MHILDLEFVIFSATCLDTIAIVKDLAGMLALSVATRADRLHVVITKDVVTLSQHICQLKLASVEHFSSRVIPLRDHSLHVSELLLCRRVYQILH